MRILPLNLSPNHLLIGPGFKGQARPKVGRAGPAHEQLCLIRTKSVVRNSTLAMLSKDKTFFVFKFISVWPKKIILNEFRTVKKVQDFFKMY